MAQSFPFGSLPAELQDMVWDMAIRDDDPAVHFFTIYDTQIDSHSVVSPAKKVFTTRSPYLPDFVIGLAAPLCRGSGQLSWSDGNLSTYLTDSGLWTACYKSRQKMQKHFRPSETSQKVLKGTLVDLKTAQKIFCKPTASITMQFQRDNGERQYLTIRPFTDLICLQLPKTSNLSWNNNYHWRHIRDFPLFRWHGHSWHWQSSHIMNVAVEYDPEWDRFGHEEENEPSTDIANSFSKVDEISGLKTFWFIDYRLKRNSKPDNRERQTFRAGRLAFIEVDASDHEWCLEGGCWDRKSSRSATYGARDLVDKLKAYKKAELEKTVGTGNPAKGISTGADFGILACVDLATDRRLPTMWEWYATNDWSSADLRLAGNHDRPLAAKSEDTELLESGEEELSS